MTYVKALSFADELVEKIKAGKGEEGILGLGSKGLIEKPLKIDRPDLETTNITFYNEYSALRELEERINKASSQEEMPEMTGPSTVSSSDIPLSKASKKINVQGKESFIQELYPTAVQVGKETGVDPRIIIAQAALETGWGKHAPGNNYFGIKSHGVSGGQVLTTKEVIGGKTVTIKDSFRSFESPKDSVRGYGEFLKSNPRYREFLSAKTLEDQVQALGRSGYATDPDYASKIYSIATGLPPISDFGDASVASPQKNPFTVRRGK
jgi:flagellum-specific peptidoglycan hydrolase FlgJ